MHHRFSFLRFLLLTFVAGHPQEFLTRTIHVSGYGATADCKALVYLPPDYSKDKSYPLVIYSHGLSQACTDITKLYTTVLPKVLKDGYHPSFDFIMVAPQ